MDLVWVHDAIEKAGISMYLDGLGPFPAEDEVRLISFADLTLDWGGYKAKEGGHLAGAPIGSPVPRGNKKKNDAAVVNRRIALGVTVIAPGNSHVEHAHPHPETYIVARGQAILKQDGRNTQLGHLDAARSAGGSPRAAQRWRRRRCIFCGCTNQPDGRS